MSHDHDTGAHPRAEDDRVASRPVLLTGVAALLVFVLAGGAVVLYLRHRQQVVPVAGLPAEVGQDKIGLVEQQLFDAKLRGARDRAARQARLDGYGWVDAPRGVLHIPIDRAMALTAEGVRVPAGEAPAPPPLGAAHGGVDATPSVPPPPATAAPGPAARPAGKPAARPAAKEGKRT
jgi:hypothetical protein